MILKNLEPLLQGPLTIVSGDQTLEYSQFADVDPTWMVRVVVRLRAEGDRLRLELRDPRSTQVLETHGYQFEAGF